MPQANSDPQQNVGESPIRRQSNASNSAPTTSQVPAAPQPPNNPPADAPAAEPNAAQIAWTSILNRALLTLNLAPPTAVQHLIRQYSVASTDVPPNNAVGTPGANPRPRPPLLRRQTAADADDGNAADANLTPRRQSLPEGTTQIENPPNVDEGQPRAQQDTAEGGGERPNPGANENVEANQGGEEGAAENEQGFVRTLLVQMQSSKFTGLVLLGSLLCCLFVSGYALIDYIYHNIQLTSFLAFLCACFHRFDTAAFKSLVSGNGRSLFLAFRIFARQSAILFALGQYVYVLPTLIYTVPKQPYSFWKTSYIVYLTAVFIKDCAMTLKLLVFVMPRRINSLKGRLYQWLEYTAILYQFTMPFVLWNAFLGKMWCTVVYAGIKILFLLALICFWLLTTINLFRAQPKFGKKPTEKECQEKEHCTICYSDFQKPVKLKCSHIFCTECIEKWLEQKQTCPFCRATVEEAMEDKKYRDGDAMDTITY